MASRAALHARFTMCGKHLKGSYVGKSDSYQSSRIIPDSVLNSIKLYLLLLKHILQVYHHGVVIAGIVTGNPSNLKRYQRQSKQININETFSVIFIRSRMNMKHSARCLPVCLPGMFKKPTRSDLSSSFFCVPVMVFTSTPSIQWAVTPMNEVRLGSDQTSVVNEIFPTDFCQFLSKNKPPNK